MLNYFLFSILLTIYHGECKLHRLISLLKYKTPTDMLPVGQRSRSQGSKVCNLLPLNNFLSQMLKIPGWLVLGSVGERTRSLGLNNVEIFLFSILLTIYHKYFKFHRVIGLLEFKTPIDFRSVHYLTKCLSQRLHMIGLLE